MVSTPIFIITIAVVISIVWLVSKLLAVRKVSDLKSELSVAHALNEKQKSRFEEVAVELKTANEYVSDLKQKNTELETRLLEQNKYAKEQLESLTAAKELMKQEFENLAQKILDEKGNKFSEQSKEQLNIILNPFKTQISEFKTKVEEVYIKEGQERFNLTKQIEQMHKAYEMLGQEANNLVRALKADTKAQGNWGEIILNRLLENSGLIEGVHYQTQAHFKTDEEKAMRPDVVVFLPSNRHIIIDSKVSIKAYEQYYNAVDDNERDKALKAHILSIKNHVKELAVKRYDFIKELTTLDFVFMFIPIEAAFMTAMDYDRDIFTEAYNQHVLIVCPSTLLVTLQMINSIWRVEDQNKNAKEIAEQGAKLYDKFVGFVNSLTDINKFLDKSQETYQKAYSQLVDGRGNLISQAQKLIKLGVKSKSISGIPDRVLLDAHEDDGLSEIESENNIEEESIEVKTET